MKKPQRSLFGEGDGGMAPWEADDCAAFWRARVVFVEGASGLFDYKIPDKLVERVRPGIRLRVPLGKGNRPVEAWCVGVEFGAVSRDEEDSPQKTPFRLKEILDTIDSVALLSEKMLTLATWMSDRWLAPLGQVLEAILPAGVRSAAGTRLTTVWSIPPDLDARRAALQKATVRTSGKTEPLTPKQLGVLAILSAAAGPMTLGELARAAKCSMVPIQSLKRLGLMKMSQVRRESAIFTESLSPVPKRPDHALNGDQSAALEAIRQTLAAGKSKTFLLHGVTASGKTEVYIRAIQEVVSRGKSAIVLVPEISLTPQTVRRFRERFDSVAVLHSHLTDPERHAEWSRIGAGNVEVVVGARSAIFAPLPRLGIIIIDEEHENSFKQETAPRYHARQVARFRAKQESIPLILGSATPSLESWHRMKSGRYERLALPKRVNDWTMPPVEVVDLRERAETDSTRGILHRRLHQALHQTLEAKGQAILLLNRRGFATQIQCPVCGDVMKCPNCDVSLTHHRTQQLALCHYCDYQIPTPNECTNPQCAARNIRFMGFGTQRLEAELATKFSGVPILRMDSDTMHGPGAHERALTAFRRGEYPILLGTQMIAKGLDFPNVTLVGVISADTALYHPDFRASERTFHLITQVAGRTGRGERPGRVLVQTFAPDHPAIGAASRHDYAAFVSQELPERERLGYPPFTEMIRVVVRGPVESETGDFAKRLAERLDAELTAVKHFVEKASCGDGSSTPSPLFLWRRLGPAPAPFAKLRGNFRYHLHLHANNGEKLRQGVARVMAEKIASPADTQWIVDVDPLDML